MRLAEFARSTTLQWAIAIAGAFAAGTLILFGFVYWETAAYMTARIDTLIAGELMAIASAPPELRLQILKTRMEGDPRRIKIAGLFAADGRRIVGNVESPPTGLIRDANPRIFRSWWSRPLGRRSFKTFALSRAPCRMANCS